NAIDESMAIAVLRSNGLSGLVKFLFSERSERFEHKHNNVIIASHSDLHEVLIIAISLFTVQGKDEVNHLFLNASV
ncbi:MAG: hypothetical protein ACI84C_000554, partial [Flavobacteriales bacterium]